MFIIEHDYYVEQLIERPRFIKKNTGLMSSLIMDYCVRDGGLFAIQMADSLTNRCNFYLIHNC